MLDDFHRYLVDHGVTLTELPRKESFAITKRWTSVFAVESDDLHETQGLKAIDKWLKTTDDQLILLFLSSRITAFPISENGGPCTAHRYTGRIIDLSAYNQLEFAVFPETYEWTLIHTHEDGAFGGPYFIRIERTPSTRDRTMP
ncbi:hypothetical protein [Rubinisphaera italica]|uniref:hypothetical protein n=1 Tax=Rubinisphaera italica TaxID=2527969 RepID=UPI0011B3CB3C|nr:hypothetical protein [Rubinisphaera italica]